jgi:hypothetical protein
LREILTSASAPSAKLPIYLIASVSKRRHLKTLRSKIQLWKIHHILIGAVTAIGEAADKAMVEAVVEAENVDEVSLMWIYIEVNCGTNSLLTSSCIRGR